MLWFKSAKRGLIGILLFLLLAGVLFVTDSVGLFAEKPCSYCDGEGILWMQPIVNPAHVVDCYECSLVGRLSRLRTSFSRHETEIVSSTWLLLGALMIYGTVYAFRVVDCSACRTRGCGLCRGRGWLAAIDRWVTERQMGPFRG